MNQKYSMSRKKLTMLFLLTISGLLFQKLVKSLHWNLKTFNNQKFDFLCKQEEPMKKVKYFWWTLWYVMRFNE